MRVAVVGAGKMGLPLACHFASRGAQVLACDTNERLVRQLNRGECPIAEPGLAPLLRRVVGKGMLRATSNTGDAVAASHTVVVIVPALLRKGTQPDLTILDTVTVQIASTLRPGTLVSYETTVPVGTTRTRFLPILEAGGHKLGVDFFLTFSPERVKSGHVLARLGSTPKVVGGVDSESARTGLRFYERYVGAPARVVASAEAAEMIKLAGMLYRDVNIALANELAAYAEAAGCDLEDLRGAINSNGEAELLRSGIGVGGHCTPVYPYFAISDAEERGVSLRLAASARRINDAQGERAVGRLRQCLGSLRGIQAVILGLGFRPAVKEHTCSPAFQVAASLRRRGADVALHDDLYSAAELRSLGFQPGSPEGASALVLCTAHEAYRALDFNALKEKGLRAVVDGRRVWNRAKIEALGIAYLGVGCG